MEPYDQATELIELWTPLLEPADWPERYALLGEIHEQLREEIPDREMFRTVSLMMVTGLIDRLGNTPITNRHQAHIYANSGDERHWRAARAWFRANRGPRRTPWRARRSREVKRGSERRKSNRQVVHVPVDLISRGQSRSCELVDVSASGALLSTREPPAIGAQIRLNIPGRGLATGSVVRTGSGFCGVAFPGRPPSEPPHGHHF